MSEWIDGTLISGKEALEAILGGSNVQYFNGHNQWDDSVEAIEILHFLDDDYKFRIKPKPILLNGVEIPPTFTPKEGEVFYYIDLEYPDSYNYRKYKSGFPHFCEHLIKLGSWKTEDDIKQVIEVLRSVLKGG